VAGTAEMIHSGPEFSNILERLGVTVPFLACRLSSPCWERDISTLRVLILGGESLPAELGGTDGSAQADDLEHLRAH